MNVQIRIGILSLLLSLFATGALGQEYYGRGQAISLLIDSVRMVVHFGYGPNQSDIDQLQILFPRIVAELDDPLPADGFVACSLATGDGYEEFLDSVQATTGVYLVEPYYITPDSQPFVIGDRLFVAFDSSLTRQEIDSIISSYHLTLIEESP